MRILGLSFHRDAGHVIEDGNYVNLSKDTVKKNDPLKSDINTV